MKVTGFYVQTLADRMIAKLNAKNKESYEDYGWWKNPMLQGPENDYGEYDYLVTRLPKNSAEWYLDRWKTRCDSCGKYVHITKRQSSYFYTYDGYDSLDYYECIKCDGTLRRKLRRK